MQMPYGNQPANAHGGTLVAATLMNRSVPAGIDASFEAGIPIPSPVNHFNLSFWRGNTPMPMMECGWNTNLTMALGLGWHLPVVTTQTSH